MPKSTHQGDELGTPPGKRVTILRKGTPPKTGQPSSPRKGSKPSIPEPSAHTPAKKGQGAKGTQPKKPKMHPPYVIFWPEDNTLWTWNTAPTHPRLLQIFEWILEELRKRDHASVTVLQYFKVSEKNPESPHAQTPCRAIDFTVGGLKDEHAGNFCQTVNAQWVYGGKPGGLEKPLRVLRYLNNEKGKHFHLEVTDNTRPVNES